MWIVTRAINDYNQDGDYFVAAFINKPTFQDLKKLNSQTYCTFDSVLLS